jgi:hypothetical protein
LKSKRFFCCMGHSTFFVFLRWDLAFVVIIIHHYETIWLSSTANSLFYVSIFKKQELGITALHIKLRATGGNKTMQKHLVLGHSLLSEHLHFEVYFVLKLCLVACFSSVLISNLTCVSEDVTPIPSDSTRRKGGRRGRRL